MDKEPLLKEEKETLVFSIDNHEEKKETFNDIDEDQDLEVNIPLKDEPLPVNIDVSALFPKDEPPMNIPEPIKETIEEKTKIILEEDTLKENKEEDINKEFIEEKKDIEIIEKKAEQSTNEEPQKENKFAKYNINKVSIAVSLILTLIVVYFFAQAVYNFYIGFKYRNANIEITEPNE